MMLFLRVLLFACVIVSVTVQNDSDENVKFPKNITSASANSSLDVGNSVNVNASSTHVSCIQNKTFVGLPVEIVNATRLAAILHSETSTSSKQVPGNCVAVLFYSPSCLFSCLAAPSFNALSRFFPNIKMAALDSITHRSFNAQYGIFGLPTLILFHNGRPAARLNETTGYNIEMFAKFIRTSTDVKPIGRLVVTSADFNGPVSSIPVKEKDYYLMLSWAVIVLRLLYSFYRSSLGRWLRDATLSAWREAEAQHHHID